MGSCHNTENTRTPLQRRTTRTRLQCNSQTPLQRRMVRKTLCASNIARARKTPCTQTQRPNAMPQHRHDVHLSLTEFGESASCTCMLVWPQHILKIYVRKLYVWPTQKLQMYVRRPVVCLRAKAQQAANVKVANVCPQARLVTVGLTKQVCPQAKTQGRKVNAKVANVCPRARGTRINWWPWGPWGPGITGDPGDPGYQNRNMLRCRNIIRVPS